MDKRVLLIARCGYSAGWRWIRGIPDGLTQPARDYSYEQARAFAEILGNVATEGKNSLITRQRIVARRQRGSVLVDATQNSYGRSLAAPYSVRAFPGAPVSCPVAPDELKASLRPERFNIKSMLKRIESRGDLWSDFWKRPQALEPAIEKMDQSLRKPAGGKQ